MKAHKKYKIHKIIAAIVVPFLVISTVSGFFRTNQKWMWPEGYKKKKQKTEAVWNDSIVSINTVIANLKTNNKKLKVEEITLRNEAGNWYYLIKSKDGSSLAEASSGKVISPIDESLATSFAQQYLKENAKVRSVELIKGYKGRKSKEKKDAYKISFENKINSEIYLETATGEILEDKDDNRAFGSFMIKLHDYDFFESKQVINSAIGIGTVFLSISGLWIMKFRKKKRVSRNTNVPQVEMYSHAEE